VNSEPRSEDRGPPNPTPPRADPPGGRGFDSHPRYSTPRPAPLWEAAAGRFGPTPIRSSRRARSSGQSIVRCRAGVVRSRPRRAPHAFRVEPMRRSITAEDPHRNSRRRPERLYHATRLDVAARRLALVMNKTPSHHIDLDLLLVQRQYRAWAIASGCLPFWLLAGGFLTIFAALFGLVPLRPSGVGLDPHSAPTLMPSLEAALSILIVVIASLEVVNQIAWHVARRGPAGYRLAVMFRFAAGAVLVVAFCLTWRIIANGTPQYYVEYAYFDRGHIHRQFERIVALLFVAAFVTAYFGDADFRWLFWRRSPLGDSERTKLCNIDDKIAATTHEN